MLSQIAELGELAQEKGQTLLNEIERKKVMKSASPDPDLGLKPPYPPPCLPAPWSPRTPLPPPPKPQKWLLTRILMSV